MREIEPFDPLDRVNLAKSAAEALLEQKPEPLGDMEPFKGAGVYSIYYTGDFPAYDYIRRANENDEWLAPVYVGKAVPKGARKGVNSLEDAKKGTPLNSRLKQHAASIRAAHTTLNIDDFQCKFLVVEDIWIPLIESLIISRFAPIWNNPVDGFGNHDPGAGRYNGLRPRWDVLHPGRAWADKCRQRDETADQIEGEVRALLAARPRPNPSMFA